MAKHTGVRLSVRVQPKASRNAVTMDGNGRVRVALTAPPVDGEANKALIAFLAGSLRVSKRDIVLVQGTASREKVVEIAGVVQQDLDAWLENIRRQGT